MEDDPSVNGFETHPHTPSQGGVGPSQAVDQSAFGDAPVVLATDGLRPNPEQAVTRVGTSKRVEQFLPAPESRETVTVPVDHGVQATHEVGHRRVHERPPPRSPHVHENLLGVVGHDRVDGKKPGAGTGVGQAPLNTRVILADDPSQRSDRPPVVHQRGQGGGVERGSRGAPLTIPHHQQLGHEIPQGLTLTGMRVHECSRRRDSCDRPLGAHSQNLTGAETRPADGHMATGPNRLPLTN